MIRSTVTGIAKTLATVNRRVVRSSNNTLYFGNSSNSSSSRCLSTISINNNNKYQVRSYTTETATTTEEQEEISIPYKFLTINKEQWEATLGKYKLPKTLEDQFTMVNKDRATLLRKPAFEVIQWLNEMREQQFIKDSESDYYKILDGRKGSGKSVALSQVVFWAQQQDWLVLYVPDAFNFINNGSLTKYTPNPLTFAQNEMCFEFLNQFLELNSEKLKNINLKTRFVIEYNNWTSSPDKTIYDLISGMKFDSATEVFYHFKKELNAVVEYPVLVAIDGYNLFFRASEYGDMYDPASFHRTLPVDRLLASSLLKDIKSHQLSNGVVVACTTDLLPKDAMYEYSSQENIVDVPKYSLYEARLFINYLVESGYLAKSPPQETIQYLYQMASGNPQDLWKLLRIMN
ncbi:hypothetical protein CYY_000687 [Polysphondylium violaceum]|uniref:Small ribosomal subunit protein mS29 n=1 Tax=Polysphondylium violaceum TaxID=133409 RepID=A0A8J4Q393_9MYCE|nr:hypothetical protein CYY_000687 [Polysphondylium violaceum]